MARSRRVSLAPVRVVAALTVFVTAASHAPLAHKAITSKYTYNEHVFPIVRDRCGRCHSAGGPTPMSLMTYREAVPWAESIREQLIGQAMPPWYVDPLAPPVKGGHSISPKELDVLLTWAVGGAPEGDEAKAPALLTKRAEWEAGPPDVRFTMPSPHVVPAGTLESVQEVVIPTTFDREKWITAIDLLPGTPSMVRAATIATEKGAILAAWVAGDTVVAAPSGTGFRLLPRENLRVQIRYRKHWQDEMVERSDRSTLGLYFGDAPVSGLGIAALTLESVPGTVGGTAAAASTLAAPVRILAVTPVLEQEYAALAVDAVLPAGGRRLTILRLQAPRPGWSRRYWLDDPLELPAGTRIEVTPITALALPGNVAESRQRIQVVLDFISISPRGR